MSFGATPNILGEFNFYEAIFWLLLGVMMMVAMWCMPHRYVRWGAFAGLNLFLFGVTDIVEVYTGGFLHTAHWLLFWKVAHVIGLVISVSWYLKIRLKS